MLKAIFYKEWIKTKWMIILSFLLLFGFASFLMLNLYRMIDIKGAIHIWDVMIQRDTLFITLINYVPLILGICLALTQYVPEMQRKSLKLTLHLPFSANKMIALMVAYGLVTLSGLFLLSLLFFYVLMSAVLVQELVRHILLTAVVWYLAGLLSYLLTSWIVLEPTWKRRVLNLFVSVLLLRIFFMSGDGEAYNSFLPVLFIYTLFTSSLVFLSVSRFKEGQQD